MNLSQAIDFTNMFQNCTSLTSINDNNYTFIVDDSFVTFTKCELSRLQQSCSNFTFENKDILRLRKITNYYIKTFHPEDLL